MAEEMQDQKKTSGSSKRKPQKQEIREESELWYDVEEVPPPDNQKSLSPAKILTSLPVKIALFSVLTAIAVCFLLSEKGSILSPGSTSAHAEFLKNEAFAENSTILHSLSMRLDKVEREVSELRLERDNDRQLTKRNDPPKKNPLDPELAGTLQSMTHDLRESHKKSQELEKTISSMQESMRKEREKYAALIQKNTALERDLKETERKKEKGEKKSESTEKKLREKVHVNEQPKTKTERLLDEPIQIEERKKDPDDFVFLLAPLVHFF